MRSIGTLKNPHIGVAFGRLLNANGIKNQVEVVRVDDPIDPNKQNYECVIWIYDEEQIEKAEFLLDQFQHEDHDLLVQEDLGFLKQDGEPSPLKPLERYPITFGITAICVLLYLLTVITTPRVTHISDNPLITVPMTASPIKKHLLFDWPRVFEQVDSMIDRYGVDPMLNPADLPPKGKEELHRIMSEPTWFGGYQYLLNKNLPFDSSTLFYSIRKGEVWRLFTPCLLHYDIFHIFFNMLWLVYLGRMLEKILSKTQYLLLILIAAIFSNTGQYLMTGPNFLGYSGVLTAYLGFIWMRQRIAPWEAYPLQQSVVTFMTIFVLGMFFLSAASFLTEFFYSVPIAPGIANTAHITGALIGMLLARIPYFSSKQSSKLI